MNKNIFNQIIIMLMMFFLLQPIHHANASSEEIEGWLEGADGYGRAFDGYLGGEKVLVVYFYTTWCPYCRDFEDEILADSEVQDYLKQVIPVRLNPERSGREFRISKNFGITGYPSVFVMPPAINRKPGVVYKMKNPQSVSQFLEAIETLSKQQVQKDESSKFEDKKKPLKAKMEIKPQKTVQVENPTKILLLKNGHRVIGEIISQNSEKIVFRDMEIGKITFRVDEIETIESI